MTSSSPNPGDPFIQILSGEAAPEALSGVERARVEKSLAVLNDNFAAVPLDRSRLLAAMRNADSRAGAAPSAFSAFSASSTWPRTLRYGLAAALILLAASLLLATVHPRIRQAVSNWINPSARTPQPAPENKRAVQLPDGQWRIAQAGTVKPAPAAQLQSDDSGTLALNAGEATVVAEGTLREPLTMLTALDGSLRLSVSSPSKAAVRVIPGKRALALSIYEGAGDAVRLESGAAQLAAGGADVDAIVLADAHGGREFKTIRWASVREALPPVADADIYLRLKNDRLMRGVVRQSAPTGAMLSSAGDNGPPESILAADIRAWVPAETPRGRAAYRDWLNESIPAQLRAAKRTWIFYVAERENNQAPEGAPKIVTPFPDVAYAVREENGKLFFTAHPAADLGATPWIMDEHGEVEVDTTTPKPTSGPDF